MCSDVHTCLLSVLAIMYVKWSFELSGFSLMAKMSIVWCFLRRMSVQMLSLYSIGCLPVSEHLCVFSEGVKTYPCFLLSFLLLLGLWLSWIKCEYDVLRGPLCLFWMWNPFVPALFVADCCPAEWACQSYFGHQFKALFLNFDPVLSSRCLAYVLALCLLLQVLNFRVWLSSFPTDRDS